jgi:hypothetical protein
MNPYSNYPAAFAAAPNLAIETKSGTVFAYISQTALDSAVTFAVRVVGVGIAALLVRAAIASPVRKLRSSKKR